jgi:hypothetical protein
LSATECKLLAKLKFRKAFLCLTLIIDESSTCSIRLCAFALSIPSYRSFLYLWQHLRFGGIGCALNENHLTFHNKVKNKYEIHYNRRCLIGLLWAKLFQIIITKW